VAITLVASTSAALGFSGGTTAAIDTTGASLLAVSLSWWTGLGGTPVFSDSKGNTYTALTARVQGDMGHRWFICLGPASVGAGHTFSATAGGIAPVIVAYAFAGVGMYKAETGAVSAGGASLATGSVTPTEAGALILTGVIGKNASTDTVTPSGFTVASHFSNSAGESLQGSAAYYLQPTIAAIDPTWQFSPAHGNTAAGTVVFQATAVAARLSQLPVEVVVLPAAELRLSQLPLEVVVLPAAGAGSITRIQATTKGTAFAQAVSTPAFTVPPTLGNAIIVPVTLRGSASFATATCTDTYGNSYARATTALQTAGTDTACAIYYCDTVVATGAGFVVTVAGIGGSSSCTICAIEVNPGTSLGLGLDQTATGIGTSTTPATAATAPLTAAEVFVVAVHVHETNQASITVEAVTPSWTQEFEQLSSGPGEADSRRLTGVAGTTTSVSWTLPTTGNWAAALAAFRAVTTAPPTRVTQAAVELLSLPTAPARVTQGLIEVLGGVATSAPPAEGLVTQALVETLVTSPPPLGARVTQVAVEVFAPRVVPGRSTQTALEVFTPTLVPGRTTQTAVELYRGDHARGRTTQLVVEVFLTVPPCVLGAFPVDDAPAGGSCPAPILP